MLGAATDMGETGGGGQERVLREMQSSDDRGRVVEPGELERKGRASADSGLETASYGREGAEVEVLRSPSRRPSAAVI